MTTTASAGTTIVATAPVATTMAPDDNQTLKNEAIALATSFAGAIDSKTIATAMNSTQGLDRLQGGARSTPGAGNNTKISYVYVLEQQPDGTCRFVSSNEFTGNGNSDYQKTSSDAPAE